MLSMFLGFLLGGAVSAPVVATVAYRTAKAQLPKVEDTVNYKEAWENSLQMIVDGGQITEAQLKAITPAPPRELEAAPALTRKEGTSFHRAQVEIARAKNGMFPADNLDGMSSHYRSEVELARIKYKTAK